MVDSVEWGWGQPIKWEINTVLWKDPWDGRCYQKKKTKNNNNNNNGITIKHKGRKIRKEDHIKNMADLCLSAYL